MATDMTKLESLIQERMGQTKLAAVSLAIVKGDEIIYQRGFGLRDLEQGLPATPQTLYGIGSVTKSFTCLAILQLHERGLLHVDDPVDRHLPLTIRPSNEPVRIRHLMSHSSGIPGLAYLENLLRHRHGASDRFLPLGSTADMLTFVNGAEDWAFSRPGERWFYLNEGYVLLGAIVEQVSGQPFAQYVKEQILKPLGMTRSTYDREAFGADLDAAVPYATNLEGKHLPRAYTWGQAQADGGLISSVDEMARYVGMYLAGGRGLLQPESLAAMIAPAVAQPTLDVLTDEPSGQYGFGLSTTDFFGRQLVAHSGMMYVATAAMQFLPEQGLGAVALANGTGYPLVNLTSFALAEMLGEDPWQLPALRVERVLSDLTGSYETYRGTYDAKVRRQGDFLMLEFKNRLSEMTVPLVPLDLNPECPRFYTLTGGRKLLVEFLVRDGQVDLIYERYRFRRVGV
jgi:CubicO group peptidase (beta-lactamase class C family)